jgi:hypothetical protein
VRKGHPNDRSDGKKPAKIESRHANQHPALGASARRDLRRARPARTAGGSLPRRAQHDRARPADGKIVVVGLDEQTYQHFGTFKFSRKVDAKLIDNLVAMGARHIYFDRTYSDVSTPADDQAMIEACAAPKARCRWERWPPSAPRTA